MSKNLSNILKGGTLPVIHGGTGVTVSTGTGSVVLNTSPSLVTPDIGIATATSINKVMFTQPTGNATLTIANNKVLTVSNTISFTGTDSAAVEVSTGGTVTYTKDKLSVFSTTTSAELAGVISDETGYVAGAILMFNDSPTIKNSIVTTSTSFDLLNTNATTVNFASAAGTISIGASGTGTTTINHNLQVAGDIFFNGTASQLSASTIEVTDTLVMLAKNNPGDIVDVGWYASYIATATGVKTYTGLVRDASESDRSWKLFSGTITAPSTTIDFGNAVYDNLKIAALTATTGNFSGQITSTLAQGTAPFSVVSTTPVTNLSIGGNAATVTTNANMTGPITGTGNVTSITSQTGTGTKFVMDTSPVLITPTIGVATATSINGLTLTASTGTLTIATDKVLTVSNTLTFTGTDTSSVAFGAGGTVAYTGGTGTKLSSFAATTSDELASVISDETGTGKLVFANTPTLITPAIGAATGTSVVLTSDSTINGLTIGLGGSNVASNTVIGFSAFSGNTTGTSNIAIGMQSLYGSTTANVNTSVGSQSMQNVQDGSANVGIGAGTLYSNTSGAQNTAIGAFAGYGSNGVNANTTGTNNVYVGYSTIGSAIDNTNEIVIGSLAVGLGSNSTVLGTTSTTTATIYGALSIPNTTASSSSITGALKVAGGVGIGGNLYVEGNLSVNGLITTINSTTITVDDKNLELGSTASPTDVTADGGGITLKGLTDKTFTWSAASNSWVSNVGITASSIQNTPIGSTTASSGNFTGITVENGGSLILKETSLNGINYISIKSPDSLAADYTITLPTTVGTAGQVLSTDGNGALTFVDSDVFGGNVVYVSESKGNDLNDGLSLPVRTIKRALQIASGMVYNSLGAVNRIRAVVSVAAGNYVENNPVIIPDNVSVEGAGLRACVIRPLNANKDMFRLRNGGYFAQFTFRDGITASGVASYTWAYAFAFDDVFDTQCDRTGYINLPSNRPTMTLSPYVQNCSIISFLGGNGAYVDGSKVANPNVPTSLLEVEVNPAGAAPVQCKSMIANAFTMISFGGTGWRVTNDAYVQLVSCFQLFLLNGVYAQSGGYTSITNSATNFGKYALRSSGYSPIAYPYDKGFVSAVGSSGSIQTVTAIGFTRPDGPVEQYVIRIYDNNAFTYNVAICQRDIGFIIDAIGYDMMFGGNFRSIKAAMTYYSTQAANVVGVQKTATIAGFTYLRDYVANAVNGDPIAGASIIANMNTINDIVNNGLSVVPASVIPEPSNIDPGFSDAARLLAGNKLFLQAEIIAFMSSTYTALWSSLTAPQRLLCQRDVGYMVDAIQYDLIYACNLETTVIGRLYYNRLTNTFVENAGEKTAALDVVLRLRAIVEYIVTNNTAGWTKSAGNAASQFISGTAATPGAVTFAKARFQEIYDTINTGTETAVAILPDTTWVVDANLVTQFNILQTTKDAIKTFVTEYISTQYGATDLTSQYKVQSPNFLQVSFNAFTEIDIATDVFTTSTPHGLTNGDSVIYDSTGNSPLGGLFTGSVYYVYFLNTVQFKLAHDDSLTLPVDVVALGTGTHTFTKNDYELYVDTVTSTHTTFQTIVLTSAYSFAPGDLLEGTTGALPNKASVYSYDGDKTIVVAINFVTIGISQERKLFATNSIITKINATVVSLTVSSVTSRNDLHAATFNVASTLLGGLLDNVGTLVGKQIFFHRASIVNSSGHTWEYAGSGIDYNALPTNGGKTDVRFEQYQERSGRVYTSGTNELGDFKVGDFITAYNRTGNIVFKNTVTVSQLNVLKLALSDISVDAISNDTGLGENEVGGPSDSKLSTQLAIWSYANQRLGAFIDKAVSTNAVPGALVQLNATGQINVDLIPAQRTSASVITYGYRSRLTAYDDVPSVNFLSGDNSTEEFETVTLTLSDPITALDGAIVTQSTSGASGLLKGDHTNVNTILVASTGYTFTTVFDTTPAHTLIINLDSTPSTTNTSVYCLVVSAAISATDNSVLRNSTTNQYLVLPTTGTYVYTFVGISKILRYNNIAYVTTDAAHLLVSSNQVKITPTTLTNYAATPYVTVLSSTRFRCPNVGPQTPAAATTTNTATVPATTGTTTVTVASASVSGGPIQIGDYVFSNINSFPIGSVVTGVTGTTTLLIAIEFPSVSDTSTASSIAGLTFIRPITEAGTVRSVITAVNNSAQGEISSIRKGMLTAVNNLTITSGSSYVSGTYYRVSLSNVTGTGSGALANITVTGDSVTAVDLTYAGSGYAVGNTVSASLPGGSGFSIPVSAIETHAYINNISDLFVGSSISPDFVSDNASAINTITVSSTISKTFNASSDVNYSTNRITIATHGYSNGDYVMYNPGSNQLISGLSITLPYYVKRIDANIIELYSEYYLTNIISLGTSSTGTHTFTTSAINITNNRLYVAAHGLSTGDALVFTGTNLPSIDSNQIGDRSHFFIGSVTTNTFTIHNLRSDALDSVNGVVVAPNNITSIGSSTLSMIHYQVQIIGYSNTSSKQISNWGLLASSSIDASNIVSGVVTTSRLATSGTASSTTYLRGDSTWSTAVTSIQSSNSALTITGSGIGAMYGALTFDVAKTTFPTDNGSYSTLGVASFNINQFTVGTGATAGLVYITAGTIDAGTLDGNDSSYYLDPVNLSASIPLNKGGTGISVYTAGDMIYASTTTSLIQLPIGPANTILSSNGTLPYWAPSLSLATVIKTGAGEISTTNAGSANVFNTNALTLNVGGAATSVYLGANSTGITLINVKSYTTNGASSTTVSAVYGIVAPISTAARNNSGVSTIVTTIPHGLTAGDLITVVCLSDPSYNVRNAVVSVTNTTTFTYSNAGSLTTVVASTGSIFTGSQSLSLATTAANGDTKLIFGSTAGVIIGQIVLGNSHIPTNTTVIGIDALNIYLSAAITDVIMSATSIVFVHTNASLGIATGNQITIASSGITNLDGTWPVTSASSFSTSFSISITTAITASSAPRVGNITKANSLVLKNKNITIGSSEASATPVAATLIGEKSVGTNVAGVDFNIIPGTGTGNAASGSFVVKTGNGAASGTSPQTPTTKLTIDNNGIATFTNSVVINQNIEVHGVNTTGITNAAAVPVKSFSKTVYRSAKLIFQVTCTSGPNANTYQIGEVLIIHDGTTAYMAEYGDIKTGANMLATFTCDIDGLDNVRILAQALTGDTISVRVVSSLNII
jgi:hypothetical protein